MAPDPDSPTPGGRPGADDVVAELEELEERYRVLVEQNLVGISLTRDGRFIHVNPRLAEIHGSDREELIGSDAIELIPEDQRDEALAEALRLVEGEVDEARVSGPIRRKDGTTAHIESYLKRTEYHGEEAILGVTVDVTDRIEAEEAREASEGRFRAVFENAMEGIVVADDDGTYVDANPAACEMFGLERDGLIGRSIEDLGAIDLDFEGRWGPSREGGADLGRFTLVRDDGERRTVEYAATADIRPNRHLAVLRDVTERVRHEAALDDERERLDFLNAMLRHHVLNGMNVVLATAERLAADAEGKRWERLETIRRRGTAIVDRVGTIRSLVRTIQRDEAGGFSPVALDATLARSIAAAEEAHDGATMTLGETDPDLRVYADGMLGSVFDDLLENAIVHNDSTDPEVRVRVEADDDDVSIHVEDDGPGIPEAVRRDVFEGGLTGERSGFGLHVVHLLVTLYDGTMEITAGDPRGTVVTVTLPRAPSAEG